MFIGEFALAMLAGWALEYLIENRVALFNSQVLIRLSRVLKTSSFIAVIGGSLGTIVYFARARLISFAQAYFVNHIYARTTHLPLAHYQSLISDYVTEAIKQFSFVDTQFLILILFILIIYLFINLLPRLKTTSVYILSVLILTFNFSFVYASKVVTVSRDTLERVPATVQFIRNYEKGNNLPFRVFSILPGFTTFDTLNTECHNSDPDEALMLQQELLMPNINMQYNIDSVGGYENFMSDNVSRVLAYVGSEQAVTGDQVSNLAIPLSEKIKIIESRKNILRTMNVKYVISHYQFTDPDFKELTHIYVGQCKTLIYIYELSGTWPRYFLLGGETSKLLSGLGAKSGLVPKYTHNSIYFDVLSNQDTMLFIGNTYLPGWQAFVDGAPVKITPAHYLYMQITVPEGKHRIELRYKELI